MQKFLILALCVTAASANAISVNPFSASDASISATGASKGVVEAFRCGGISTFLELRIDGCNGTCHMTPGHRYDLEADIIPAVAAPSLSFRAYITVLGFDTELFDVILANSSVQPGFMYTITFSIVPNDVLSGQDVSVSGYITHTDTELLELCIMTRLVIL